MWLRDRFMYLISLTAEALHQCSLRPCFRFRSWHCGAIQARPGGSWRLVCLALKLPISFLEVAFCCQASTGHFGQSH